MHVLLALVLHERCALKRFRFICFYIPFECCHLEYMSVSNKPVIGSTNYLFAFSFFAFAVFDISLFVE